MNVKYEIIGITHSGKRVIIDTVVNEKFARAISDEYLKTGDYKSTEVNMIRSAYKVGK